MMARAAFPCLLLLAALAAPARSEDLTVEVQPNHLRLAHGETAHYTFEARTAQGAPVAGIATWEVLPASLGRIGPDGSFEASGVGRGLVRVTVNSGAQTGIGHAMLTVTPVRETLTALVSVEPRAARVAPGAAQQFRARATHPATGAEIPEAEIEWRVVPEGVGRVDASGLFVAGPAPGSGHVVARARGRNLEGLGESRVVVEANGSAAAETGRLEIELLPARAVLRPGETREFAARVLLEGRPLQRDVAVEWSVVPAELGTVDGKGTLVAGRVNLDGRLVASVVTRDGVKRGYAPIAVRDLRDRELLVQLAPREAVLSPGGEIRFRAAVVGPDGEAAPVDVSWELVPPTLGRISPDGVLTVANRTAVALEGGQDEPRRGEVIARVRHEGRQAIGRARVTVQSRESGLWLRVRPNRASVAPGEQVRFVAELVAPGQTREVAATWRLRNPEIGTVTNDGLFTASATMGDITSPDFGARDGAVLAEAQAPDGELLRGSAMVLVRPVGGDLQALVQPEAVTLQPGDAALFRFQVNGRDATTLGVPVVWLVDPPDLGEIGPGGDFRASESLDLTEARTGRVIAEAILGSNRRVRATATLRLEPRPEPAVVQLRMALSPSQFLLQPGKGIEFSLSARKPDGNLLAPDELQVGSSLMLSLQPQDIGYVETQRGIFHRVVAYPDHIPPPERPFNGRLVVEVDYTDPADGKRYVGRLSAAVTVSRHGGLTGDGSEGE